MKNLVCCAMPFGYGPAAKLITLASRLHPHLNLTFLGHGISLELIARSPEYFKQVFNIKANDLLARQIIAQSDGVLSIMDREFAEIANQLNKPLYVVDSLLWMRSKIPDELASAQIYWAQNFPGLKEISQEFQPLPTLIGPIVSLQPKRQKERSGLLINLGGCRTPDNHNYQQYAHFILEGVTESRLLEQFEGKVTVIGGNDSLESLSHSYPDLTLISVSYQEATRLISQSTAVLTAPGMTTTLECFNQEIPTFFLPPENYSQCCILHILRQYGLAQGSFHWVDLLESEIPLRLIESERPQVARQILRLIQDNQAKLKFLQSLKQLNFSNQIDLVQKQKEFLHSLGTNGAISITEVMINR